MTPDEAIASGTALRAIAELQTRINQGVANGLNQAAQVMLNDVRQHVQVRSGRLQSTYAIVQQATPQQWEARVDSPQNYKRWQYPYKIPQRIPTDRNRALQGNPLLGDGDPEAKKFKAVVQPIVEAEIQKALS